MTCANKTMYKANPFEPMMLWRELRLSSEAVDMEEYSIKPKIEFPLEELFVTFQRQSPFHDLR